ncbi:MAG: hypothetical protein JJ892_08390 [Balneola sp.]|nr:hypothetical protein [Balneola sp.]
MFFVSCATHAPMSEMVMYTPKKVISEDKKNEVIKYYSKFSFGVSAQTDFLDYSALREYANKKGHQGPIYDYDGSTITGGLVPIFLFDKNDEFAFSLTTGFLFGVDATIKLYENYYLTGGYTAFGGGQVILQKRVLNTYSKGASVGVFFDYLYQATDGNCSYVCLGPGYDDIFYVHVVGLRGNFLATEAEKNRSFLSLNSKVGYLFETQTPYLSLGVTLGAY